MNYFNTVFSTVQQKCKIFGVINETRQLEEVAQKSGLPIDRLYFYLDCLKEMEVIEYYPSNKSVALTDIGKEVTSVFPHLMF